MRPSNLETAVFPKSQQKIFVALLMLGYIVGIGCSNEEVPRHSGGIKKKNSAQSEDSEEGGKPGKGKSDDTQEEETESDEEENTGAPDPSIPPKDDGAEPPVKPIGNPMDPVVPPKDPVVPPKDPVVPPKDPVIPPVDPMVPPNNDEKAKLELACTPKVTIVNKEASAYNLYVGIYQDPAKEIAALVKKGCMSMHRKVADMARQVPEITITIQPDKTLAYAHPGSKGGQIVISSQHLLNYSNASAADRKTEFNGVTLHEGMHLYQNFTNGRTYFSEGLCDAIRADELLYPKNRKQKGRPYDGSYTDTGFFLRYMRKSVDPDFYPKFNVQMKSWNDNFWKNNYGKTVQELHADFQKNGFDPNDW